MANQIKQERVNKGCIAYLGSEENSPDSPVARITQKFDSSENMI